MTKEQFDVLLKAKHIMVEQADDAIAFMRTCELEDSVTYHYELYLAAFNNLNFKVAEKVLKSLVRQLPRITDDRTKGIVYSMMVADALNNEKYNNAITIYYEYKKLGLEDTRLNYNFDNFMLHILGENKIYSRYKKFAHALSKNDALKQADAYNAITFYYNSSIICYEVSDFVDLESNVNKIVEIQKSDQKTLHPIKCQYLCDIMQIFLENTKAKTKKDKINIVEKYKEFLENVTDNPTIEVFDRIDAHLPLVQRAVEVKDYVFAKARINKMLSGNVTTKIRIKLYQFLCDMYREAKDNKYVQCLEILNKLLLKQEKKDKDSVNEGIINSIRFHEVQQSYKEIQHRYETDQLTGCYSRNVLYKRASKTFAQGQEAAIVFFDLDDLKETNDAYNHSYGDQYLRIFVNEISKMMEEGMELFRYGGDEFVLIFPHADMEIIEKFIKDVIERFKEPELIYNKYIKINFSAGIALYPEDGTNLEDILKIADDAMYEAKKNHIGYHIHSKDK